MPSGSGYVRQAFPGNIIPASRMDIVGKNAVDYYPAPNLPGALYTAANNYFVRGTAVLDSYQLDAKVDENISDLFDTLRNARVVFNQSKRAAKLAEVRAPAVRADTAFQTFLACLK